MQVECCCALGVFLAPMSVGGVIAPYLAGVILHAATLAGARSFAEWAADAPPRH